MNLAERLNEDLKTAMKEKDAARLGTLRLVRAELLKRQKEKAGVELTDELVADALSMMVKQRRDSIEQYMAADRQDLAAAERAEIEVIAAYLPQELSDEEIHAAIDAALVATGAASPSAMGKVMGPLMKDLKATGRPFDGKRVNALLKARLEAATG